MISLRDALGEDDWLSSMMLLFRNEMHKHNILIIVEGITDIKFFNAYRLDNRFIYESPENGKREVISAVNQLREAGNDAVYGICDADFDGLSGISHNGVFFTDAHDLEMMLVKGGVVDKFIMTHTERKLIQGNLAEVFCRDVKINILCACYRLGLLKWFNYLNHSKLNFKGMNYREFININKTEVIVDDMEYIRYVLSRSRAVAEQLNAGVLLEGMRKLELMSPEHFSICNGHDFTCILKMMYETDISVNRNMRLDEIDNYLRLCYDQPTFKTTRLHTSLNQLLALH
ncbi:TPA: DUF4435 domain-containing protein [Klebsiella pneumoniae]|uniref:DUF4435 domain-containing protein n=3 Tax=Klebsiella pneumoniae TaxID=573 RepID=A0ACC7QIW2_KLEPN|nr:MULTISPECIES: DUF4435 domain-containing protein [Klebsiella]HBZ7370442.1 DUF4435 domain-containing protein [Klebsiella variicola subsp. variicola]HDH1770481.1 DUF4435 domain-containing protein [Klebsiella quasipneumoniae subsp. similipneumoniae]HDK6653642.1 DUF4435 domain-containing protein [Klebsiella variicola]HDT3401803.1 DUF4435 domain-containing protein [Klebsiella pneumoniae subsp. ozaenae]ALH84787.1 hypothetical protein AN966_07810 [Klebsiella pneumoniae]